MPASQKFGQLLSRFVAKAARSQTPLPGIAMGLSGTDSAVAFKLAGQALAQLGIPDRLLGVHYVGARRRAAGWFERDMVPWLANECPDATVIVREPLGGNQDPQRWADLHLRALNEVDGGIVPHPPGRNFWVAGTVNATERYLGTFSMLADSTSVQLVQSLWKSEILELCAGFGVPKSAMDAARLPDCLCGRDELAAANIELVDQIIRHTVDPSAHDPVLLGKLIAWVHDTKAANSFKERTPFAP